MARKFINFIKLFLVLTMLIFSLQSWTKADDISEFEIEGMSIGDSLLDYFSEDEIKRALLRSGSGYKSNKFKRATFISSNFEIYNAVFSHLKLDDKTYEIYSIGAALDFPNDVKNCNIKRKKIVNELKDIFVNYVIDEYRNEHPQDTTGQSFYNATDFDFRNGSSARIMCFDWSEDIGFIDHLRVTLNSKEFNLWLNNEAY